MTKLLLNSTGAIIAYSLSSKHMHECEGLHEIEVTNTVFELHEIFKSIPPRSAYVMYANLEKPSFVNESEVKQEDAVFVVKDGRLTKLKHNDLMHVYDQALDELQYSYDMALDTGNYKVSSSAQYNLVTVSVPQLMFICRTNKDLHFLSIIKQRISFKNKIKRKFKLYAKLVYLGYVIERYEFAAFTHV